MVEMLPILQESDENYSTWNISGKTDENECTSVLSAWFRQEL